MNMLQSLESSSDFDQKQLLKFEQVKLLYEAMPVSMLASLINAAVLVAVEWNVLEHMLSIIWLASIVIVTLARFGLTLLYHRAQPEPDRSTHWEIYFNIGSILAAIIWGSTSLLLFPENSIAHQVFLAFIIGGMCAGAVTTLSPLPLPIFSFLIFALGPLIIRFFMVGSEISTAMGGMLFLFFIMLAVNSLRIYRNIEQNIELRMQSEKQKKIIFKSKLEQQVIFDNAPVGIWLVGMDGRYRFVNKTFCDATGVSENEFLSTTQLVDLLGEKTAANCLKSDHECLEQEGPHISQETLTFVDGKQHLLEITKVKVRDEADTVTGIVGIAIDITERHLAEDKLRKLSQAIEQAGESVIITDKQGTIEYVNPAFTNITGYTSEEVMGKNPRVLKSGNESAEYYERLWSTINNGEIWHSEVIDKRKDGSQYPALLSISPILDNDGQITHFIGIQQDMTAHKTLEAQFRQAQKMEAIGTLVGGIAHDFNNMLSGMTGNLYLAKQQTREMPGVLQNLANVEELSHHAATMIQQLLTFARKGQVSMQQIPFNPFLRETLKLLRTSVPENIEIHQDICSDALQINGDSTQLHQVLLNLINNARDAAEGVETPCIIIRLEAWHTDDTFMETHPYFKVGAYAHLSVEDNGCGIPEPLIKHLFEPFFTTKEEGKGTGLGLAMVFGVIKTHHGFVEVESVEGEGSTFHLYLPLLKSEDVITASSQQLEEARGHGEMILLVDDQQQVVETGKAVLGSLGYQVLTAADGKKAVELFEARAKEIDLVILDIVMPVMGGHKAAQCIRQINPHAKIILSTGYDKDIQTDIENEIVLRKPFSIEEMSHLIRQQLDS